MPLATLSMAKPIDYSVLHNVTLSGPTLGFFADQPIAASILDEFGRRYRYAGIAPRRHDGQLDADALQPGEFIVEPGLIYRLDSFR